MADVSRVVRTAVQSRLSNATTGFNANYSAIQSSYAVPPFQVDWSDRSANFCYGMVPPDLAERTSVLEYPLLTISADRSVRDQGAQRVRFHEYSGTVSGVIQVVVSWSEEGIRDFESWPDAVIDAMFETMNNTALGSSLGSGVIYNGDLDFAKGSILAAGQNWRRQILFPFQVRVLTAA